MRRIATERRLRSAAARSRPTRAPGHRRRRCDLRPTRRGFSLVELMIVVALVGILTATILPLFQSTSVDRLAATAQIVAADLDYARSLAISNASKYRVTYDLTAQRYVLQHSGANSALNTLPPSPFRKPGDPSNQQISAMADFPRIGAAVEIAGVRTAGATPQTVTDVEFGSLGATTRSDPTVIWLACGAGTQRRYIPVEVDPATGTAAVGDLRDARPTGITR